MAFHLFYTGTSQYKLCSSHSNILSASACIFLGCPFIDHTSSCTKSCLSFTHTFCRFSCSSVYNGHVHRIIDLIMLRLVTSPGLYQIDTSIWTLQNQFLLAGGLDMFRTSAICEVSHCCVQRKWYHGLYIYANSRVHPINFCFRPLRNHKI